MKAELKRRNYSVAAPCPDCKAVTSFDHSNRAGSFITKPRFRHQQRARLYPPLSSQSLVDIVEMSVKPFCQLHVQ
jgi:hypothetical protein